MANTLRVYVNATVYVFLRVKNVSDEVSEEEQNPHCMSGALRVEVTRTPQIRCIFFSKAFDVVYTFRNLGRLPKIQKPKQRCQYSGQATEWTVCYSNATLGKRCISFQTLRPALDLTSILFKVY